MIAQYTVLYYGAKPLKRVAFSFLLRDKVEFVKAFYFRLIRLGEAKEKFFCLHTIKLQFAILRLYNFFLQKSTCKCIIKSKAGDFGGIWTVLGHAPDRYIFFVSVF